MGRRIHDNLRKVMAYLLAVHLPIAGLALLPVMLGLPPLLLPVHVVVIQMAIDPMCSLAFENTPQARDLMSRPPRAVDAPLVDRGLVLRALAQGGALLVATLAAYAWSLGQGGDADQARTLAFVGLTAGNLLLVWLNASEGVPAGALMGRAFRAYWVVAAVAVGLVGLALTLAPLRALLAFAVVPPAALALAVAVALGAVLAAWALGRYTTSAGSIARMRSSW